MGKKKYITNFMLILLGIVFVAGMVLIMILNRKIQTENFWDNQQDRLFLITEKCVIEINNWAKNQADTVKNLGNEISAGRFTTREEYESRLALAVEQDSEIQAAYISLDNGVEYFNNDFVAPEDDSQDFYTWYQICMEAEGEIIFTEPYLDSITGGIVISCMKAITMPDGVKGTIGIDIPIEKLISKIDGLRPSQNGGAYLVSPQYKVMTYYVDPSFLPKIVEEDGSFADIDINETLQNPERTPKYIIQGDLAFLNAGWVLAQVDILKVIDKYDDTNGIHIEYINDYDNVEKYEAITTIPLTGWILGVNIPLPDYDSAVQKVIDDQNPIIFLAVLMAIISIIFSFILINGIKRQQNLQKSIEIAQTASKTKSDFLSRMSHEIRTPMNAIIGMAKIADNTDDIGKLRYCLSTIETSSTHLLGIINDILDMSKIEAGKLELYEAPMSVEKMLMKICNLIVDKTDQKNQKLDIILGKDMGMNYIGDEMRLSQVITNILSNAVKFTPDFGKITLTVDEMQREGDSSILRFTVTDTGIGMTDEQIGRLFHSFEQADSGISRRFGGTGLGLAISRSIVEKMDGRIWAESEEGKGSSFMFEIKIKRADRQEGPIIFDGISPSDLRILVVDNDTEIRTHFKSITENFGICTEEAESGKKAIYLVDMAKETKKTYDVIFIDYDMPEMDGIETAKNLSAKIDKNTVIIMTSFLMWNKIEKKAADAGVNRFISKPLFPSSILDAINDVVGKSIKNLDMKTDNTKEVPDFSNVSLLLAEDVDINREIFIALLENTKVSIDTAENGLEAVQKFSDNPDKYDLIIMDVQMPEMDGYEATRQIRAMSAVNAKSIPIIAMTANAFKEDVDRCLENGMNDHISKPIDENVVIEKISCYLDIRKEEKNKDLSLQGKTR